MLKDWLKELFGVVFYGLTFERILWTMLLLLGLLSLGKIFKGRKQRQPGSDPGFGLVTGLAMTGVGGYFAAQAWLSEGYQLFFRDPLVLHTYGVAIATGFIVAIWLSTQEARRTGLDPARVLDLSFWVLLAAMAGSRLLFMLVEWRSYYERCFEPARQGLRAADCMAPLRFWEGGLVVQGGLIAATLAGLYYLSRNKLDVWRYADVASASIPIGQFFGRLGCLAAGCCHGSYVDPQHWAGVRWSNDTAAWRVIMGKLEQGPDRDLFMAEQFVTAHPTQLYEAGASLFLFLFLVWVRSQKRAKGQILALYLMGYAIIRFTIEFFRGDDIRGVNELAEGISISTGQGISLLMFGAGVGLWMWRARAHKAALSRDVSSDASEDDSPAP